MLKCPEFSGQYVLEVSREGNLDQMTVSVELSPEAHTQVGGDRRKELASQLQHRIKTSVGISVRVLPVDPFTLPRSAGKACRVIDTRSREARGIAATPEK